MSEVGKLHVIVESIGSDSRMPVELGLELLSDEETARAERFRFEIHRDRYIRGRAMLRQLLGRATSRDPGGLVIETEAMGKPYLRGESIAFNVSHTENVALFAYSTSLESVGVDIECLDRQTEFEGLIKRFYTENEQRQFEILSGDDRRRLFFRLWTAKEARMKLTGEGLGLSPRKIDVRIEWDRPVGYAAPAPMNLPLEMLEVEQFNAVAAITADREFEMEFRSV